jgi:hypothetical protein
MGGRTSAALAEKDAQDQKARVQAAYKRARAELESPTGATPAAELQRLLEVAKSDLSMLPASRPIAELEALKRRGCGSPAALAGQVRASCPRYDAELARAWERQRLTSKIEELGKAASEPSSASPTSVKKPGQPWTRHPPSWPTPGNNPDVLDLVFRGYAALYKRDSKTTLTEAREFFEGSLSMASTRSLTCSCASPYLRACPSFAKH